MGNLISNKKKLPVSLTPFIRPFASYIFYDSIMNNSTTTGDRVAKISLYNDNINNWITYMDKASFELKENSIEIFQDKYINGAIKCLYQNLSDIKEITFHIDYQQFTNRWDAIAFFIDDSIMNFSDYMKAKFSFGRHCCGRLFTNYKNKYELFQEDIGSMWFRITIMHQQVSIFISPDATEWNLLETVDLELEDMENLICGFNFTIEDSQYYKWIFNNFIQLRFNGTEQVRLHYTNLLKRDWRIYAMNPIVKTAYVKTKIVSDLGISMLDFIKANIENNRYIEFWLNEFYIPGLEAYQKYNFMHENLVFGFDDQSSVLNTLSIFDGKVVELQVNYSDFIQSYENRFANKETIYCFEYNPTDSPYDLDLIHIFHSLEDYLEGRNSTEDYSNLTPIEEGVFGIKIYDEILNDSNNKAVFLSDRRISYLLSEHKRCMYERIMAISMMGAWGGLNPSLILQGLTDCINLSQIIMSLVLKNIEIPSNSTQGRIWRLLEKLRDQEKDCYKRIIQLAYLL